MSKAFKGHATLCKANFKKCSKINEDLEDEFVKQKINCPKDTDAAMHMLVNLSNGKKSKTVPTPNIEGGLQFANVTDKQCFKCGRIGHDTKTCKKTIDRASWWIKKNEDKAPSNWKCCKEWKESQATTNTNDTSNSNASNSNSNNVNDDDNGSQ